MGRLIEGDALTALDRALGLTGSGTAVSELQDATVDQVLDVHPIVRRSRAPGGSTGLFSARLQNIHAGAGDVFTVINPFAVPDAAVVAPYPTPFTLGFDLWILDAVLMRNSGSGTIAALLDVTPVREGFTLDSAGASGVAAVDHALAVWDSVISAGVVDVCMLNGGGARAVINMRYGANVPSGFTPGLVLWSTASALSTYTCQITLGMFPASLGQDGTS